MTDVVLDAFVSPFGDTPWGSLSPEQKREWRRAYGRWHYRHNRDRYAERFAANYRANPEPAKQRARAHNGTRDPAAEHARKTESNSKHREERNARLRARRATPAGRERRAEDEAQRRAARHAANAERVLRRVVWERDEGWCYLCGYAVDPKGWHLDHVIPIARGGAHTYANVAVTHAFCNRAKGARLP